MKASPLQEALDHWSRQDDMGGFRAVARMLFPGWEPKRSCRAPHREDGEKSFSVFYRNGRWKCNDFGDALGARGLVGFVMLQGLDEKQASRWLIDNARTLPVKTVASSPEARPASKPPQMTKIPPLSDEIIQTWREGVEYLEATPARIARLASFRGWPVEFADYVVGCGIVSMPLYHEHRAIAFLVEVPESIDGKLNTRAIGFHARLKPREGQKKASWRFVPNAAEYKQSIPALPFIIAGTGFCSARLLVIAEGQWDALTFPLAAGWLGDGCFWPKDVCVLGIRGASGTSAFLQYYEPFWPMNADCLLLPDGDETGKKWFEGSKAFSDSLARLCRKVAVVGCGTKKDFNELYRESDITSEQIADLLASHGMMVGSKEAA